MTGGARPCEVCAGTQFRRLYDVTDTNQDVPGAWAIAQCEACGLGRLDPMPSADEVGTFYQDAFYAEGGQRFRPWMERLRRGLSALRGRRLRALLPGGGRLLDFGAGSGHFAAAQRARGWQAVAVDPYSYAEGVEAGARIVGGRVVLDCTDGHYDAVTLWYVIEHLVNPREAIREFHRALRPGGVLVLAQQDFSSVQARLFRQRWLFLDPPRHLFQFTPATLIRMAEDEGFRCRHVTSASLEMGPFTIFQSALNCLVGNQNYVFRFLKHRRLSAEGGQIDERKSRLSLPLALSFALTPVLAPAALVAYFLLLAIRSGDVFTVYLERR
jgi:SAM-dependent methyltransferase